MPIGAGARLGPYELIALLGKGGMGEVYRARDPRLGREVAIKILSTHLAQDPAALTRFEREAKAVASLNHPNILAIHDFGTDQSVSFAVTELLDGETLRSRLAHGPVGWRKAIKLGAAMADGLAAAHAKGIIHRDLKPENIFLSDDNRLKILDFGLARIETAQRQPEETQALGAEVVTAEGVVMGSPGYMSPEQLRGLPVDPRTDIFSWGCVVYEMLTGKAPFTRPSGAETISAILTEDPPDLAELVGNIPAGLEGLLRHCLEKKPGHRFHSAQDLAYALRAVVDSGVGTDSGPTVVQLPRSRVPRPSRRLWKWLGTVAASVGLLAAGAWAIRRWWPVRQDQLCYSCFWDGQDPRLKSDLLTFYRFYSTPDPLVAADVRYIVWRTGDSPDCDALQAYRQTAERDTSTQRRYLAQAIRAFGARECGNSGDQDFESAAKLAQRSGLNAEANTLAALKGRFTPSFEDIKITSSLEVPADPKFVTIGESRIDLPPGSRVAVQVDRVARDWLSYQLQWDLTEKPLPASQMLPYHEGSVLQAITSRAAVQVYPITGAFIASREGHWFAADDTGTYRFMLLHDKAEYPTTHQSGPVAFVEDTHGVSMLVSQAVERDMQLAVGSGDAEGEAKAAFYLAQRGIHVLMPADRYIHLLLGYRAKGVVLGTAPIRKSENGVVLGDQPIRFSLADTFVVEDSKSTSAPFLDAPARYFRQLGRYAPINAEYVEVDTPNQLGRVLDRATSLHATSVAVRVATREEDALLRDWLKASPAHYAILFHSSLYPFAQSLFDDFPYQVTFGDPRPRFD